MASLRSVLACCVALVCVRTVIAEAQTEHGEIRGRLVQPGVDTPPLAGASVGVRRGSDTTFSVGTQVRGDGSFAVTGLAAGRYSLRFRAMGFAPLVRADIVLSREHPLADLGSITLVPVAATLSGQQVVGERDDVELQPDRNSYAVKNMTASTGGTAIDVLRNVPSVEVDGENKVSLRGNENIVVQINGRTSTLKGEQLGAYLAQLPASAVAHVEVATNPSAKNDPEGAGGIINIVLTQKTDTGLSGGMSMATGTTGAASFSANVGDQSGPWSFLTSFSYARDRRDLDGSSDRTNLEAAIPMFVNSQIGGSLQFVSKSLTTRTEYKLTERDALSIDAVVAGGRYARLNTARYSDLNVSRAVIGLFDQFSDQSAPTLSQDYAMAYHRTGGTDAPTFSVETRYTQYGYTLQNQLSTALLEADASTGFASPAERDETKQHMPAFTLQSDYAHPFANHAKLESGMKVVRRATSTDFSAALLDSATSMFVPAPSRTNVFDYHEQISAAYALVSKQAGKITAQGGLRVEQATTQLVIPGTAQPFDNNYLSLFPSGLLSYDVTSTRQVKASYSRRITRPDPFQLNPIAYRDDARNVFQGNPLLRPEYTDAFELGLQETRGWGSVQVSPYLRKTAHAVRYIRSVDSTGVTFSTFDNVASATAAGTDVNVNVHEGRLTFSGGGGAYRYDSDAGSLAPTLSAHTFVWTTRANVSWRFTPLVDVQFLGTYRSPLAVEGGTISSYVMTNFTVRDKLWGDQGSVTLRVTDPFRMTSFGRTTHDAFTTETSDRRFGLRGVFLTISRTFGQELKLLPKVPEGDAPAAPQPGSPR